MTDSQNDIGAPRPAGDWVTTGRAVDTIREEVFNDVIYGLSVLLTSERALRSEQWRGIEKALEYVKAMAATEA